MNWTEILAEAGIPEPPGRQETVEKAIAISLAKKQAKATPKSKSMKFFTLTIAALLAIAPAHAQELPPVMLMKYAQLGAATLGKDQMQKGHYTEACLAYRHLQMMEAETSETMESRNATTRLINVSCGSDY